MRPSRASRTRFSRTRRTLPLGAAPGVWWQKSTWGASGRRLRCSSTTLSEIVVPVLDPAGELLAVLDVDSNLPAAFDVVDQEELEAICAWIGAQVRS